IHSFWVPALGGKRDLTPGRATRIAFRADSVGEYLGQCAEFCGVSHANMRTRVFVDSGAAFETWVAAQRRAPAPPPAGSVAERGRRVFARSACIACHTVAGVPQARGTIGPDLTHVGGRSTIAAGLFPNRPEYLRPWIVNAPALKPGALMTPQALSDADLEALVAYLMSLR
ncbi:MAG: c-type cytochrome, partial [Gemmatimonadales bacterium]